VLDDQVLVDDWHVVARSGDVPEGAPVGARLLEEDLVLWRAGGCWPGATCASTAAPG